MEIPAILKNQERLRQFKLANPDWKYLTPERVKERWNRFVRDYKDGITRIASKEQIR